MFRCCGSRESRTSTIMSGDNAAVCLSALLSCAYRDASCLFLSLFSIQLPPLWCASYLGAWLFHPVFSPFFSQRLDQSRMIVSPFPGRLLGFSFLTTPPHAGGVTE
ncbi:hypothetical protein M430DRAFT_253118 [Amorphotheca resinae ATCC 22711]|uniref:Uncharacterized protein n=1 Tax=Amorphotheca resinae ATCC 22711 TaxID=857342 RepID=A0A2T3AXL3_AMORE|nr:hypothetical protein M430DRAFT_253118 [Amorphotheca resinae ATCC 22711]PSS14808.1 hypothetical protein M430DRAFT_253118 [Amorphotheca resinae ATCC 22711]